MEDIEFDVLFRPRPRRVPEFRKSVAAAATCAFGPRRFWNEVWLRIEFRFNELFKHRVSGDIDNYVKPVLDALSGIAYNDDGQVAGIEAYWIDYPDEGVHVGVRGADLLDMSDYDEVDITIRGLRYTFVVPRNLPPALRTKVIDQYRRSVAAYNELLARGFAESVAIAALPQVCHRYPVRGGAARSFPSNRK